MTVDQEKIKKALTDFEEDNYMDAKDAIGGEIRKARDTFLKDKLGLKNDINPEPEETEEE